MWNFFVKAVIIPAVIALITYGCTTKSERQRSDDRVRDVETTWIQKLREKRCTGEAAPVRPHIFREMEGEGAEPDAISGSFEDPSQVFTAPPYGADPHVTLKIEDGL